MESLNEIMRRTAPRHQQGQERRITQQDMVSQEQRPKQPLTRRPPLPEQTVRTGQPPSPGALESQPSRKPLQQPFHGGNGNPGQRQIPKFPPQRPAANDQMLQRSNTERRPGYPSHDQQSPQEPLRPAPRAELRSPATPYQRETIPPKITRDHYETYPPLPPADVQQEWDDGEATILYGDWETEVSGSRQRSPQTDPGTTFSAQQDAAWSPTRIVPQHQPGSSPVTRETPLPPARETGFRSPLTRNLREERFVQAQPPAPQALPQETQYYQRITQPLNPRVIASIESRS